MERAVSRAPSVDETSAVLNPGLESTLRKHTPEQGQRPKRPWISQGTSELIEHRVALWNTGLLRDARELEKLVKHSARADRARWVNEGLQDQF